LSKNLWRTTLIFKQGKAFEEKMRILELSNLDLVDIHFEVKLIKAL